MKAPSPTNEQARAWLFGLVAFVSGLTFALGLALSGMGRPAKVLAFLDVAGTWDPTLAFVMAGAIAVHLPFATAAKRLAAPVLDDRFVRPSRDRVDPALIVGAAVFGVGWGLQGYCPGPAVLAVASLDATPLAFLAAMMIGLTLVRTVRSPRS